MSETVEDDDNMLVLVVEDEEHTKDYQQSKIPLPLQIKIEPLDNSVRNDIEYKILKPLAFEEDAEIGKEKYLKECLEEHGEDSEEYKIEYLEDKYELDCHEEDDPEYSDHEYKIAKKKTQKVKPLLNYNSYVEQLRQENPIMAEDEKLLIKHLANKMRDTTPPAPPDNYYKVVRDREGKNKYICTFCGAKKDTIPGAAHHFQFYHGEPYLTCYACGTQYKNTTSLYKHEKRCRAPDAAVVLRARGEYLGRKGRGRPFTTDNRFVTGQMLALKHAKSSSMHGCGGRRYYCAKCPASFSHRNNLEAHENTHEGRRPYRCDKCPASYTSHIRYQRHLTLHGDCQYICDHCGRKFKRKDALVPHLQTHQPLRKHPCLYCERRFAQKSAFLHHMNTVHLNLPGAHGCPVCPKRYAKMTQVKEHMAKKHALTMITAQMFLRVMPTLTDEEVISATKLFNFGANYSARFNDTVLINQDVEYILPDLSEETTSVSVIDMVTKIAKGKVDKYENDEKGQTEHEPKENDNKPETDREEIDHEDGSDYTIEYLEGIDETHEENANPKKDKYENAKPKIKKKQTQAIKEISKHKLKKKRTAPHSKKIVTDFLKIDEEMDVDMCNIEYKRERKSVNPVPQIENTEDDMYKIVRDIKSALTNRKKQIDARVQKKKSTKIATILK